MNRKVIYLLFFILLLLEFWNIKPIGEWFSADQFLIAKFAYLVLGWCYFGNSRHLLNWKNLKLFWWIVLGMCLSMIPAMLYHNQMVVQSIITYRQQFLWFVIPVLLKIAPTNEELTKTCWLATILLLCVSILKHSQPDMFVLDELTIERIDVGVELEYYVDGMVLATIPIFYHLGKIRINFNWKSVFVISVCLFTIFLIQNRSTLFPIVLIVAFSFLTVKTKYRLFVWVFAAIVFATVAYQTKDVWLSLLDETVGQLNDTEYNRKKAFVYFLSPLANPSWLTYLLGNGFLSSHSTSLMQDMMALGVYNSDLGLVGFWNQFGIIPIVCFLAMYIQPLVKWNTASWPLKMFTLFMIAISLTIGYFGATSTMLFFSIYYYWFYWEKRANEENLLQKECTIK